LVAAGVGCRTAAGGDQAGGWPGKLAALRL
jgi:hypothetical protein